MSNIIDKTTRPSHSPALSSAEPFQVYAANPERSAGVRYPVLPLWVLLSDHDQPLLFRERNEPWVGTVYGSVGAGRRQEGEPLGDFSGSPRKRVLPYHHLFPIVGEPLVGAWILPPVSKLLEDEVDRLEPFFLNQ